MSFKCNAAKGQVDAIIFSSFLKIFLAAGKPTFLAVFIPLFLIPQVPPCPEHFSILMFFSSVMRLSKL